MIGTGAILLSAKKDKDMSLQILAALVMSAFFMLVHLFFTGTYAVLAVGLHCQSLPKHTLTILADCGISKRIDQRFSLVLSGTLQLAGSELITVAPSCRRESYFQNLCTIRFAVSVRIDYLERSR